MTIDTIIEELKKHVADRQDLMPGHWVDKAATLAILTFDLNNDLKASEMNYNRLLDLYRESGLSAAASEIKAKASKEYEEMLNLKLKHESCLRFISLAKTRSYLE